MHRAARWGVRWLSCVTCCAFAVTAGTAPVFSSPSADLLERIPGSLGPPCLRANAPNRERRLPTRHEIYGTSAHKGRRGKFENRSSGLIQKCHNCSCLSENRDVTINVITMATNHGVRWLLGAVGYRRVCRRRSDLWSHQSHVQRRVRSWSTGRPSSHSPTGPKRRGGLLRLQSARR